MKRQLSKARATLRTLGRAHEIGTGGAKPAALVFVERLIRQHAAVGAAVQRVERPYDAGDCNRKKNSGTEDERPGEVSRRVDESCEHHHQRNRRGRREHPAPVDLPDFDAACFEVRIQDSVPVRAWLLE